MRLLKVILLILILNLISVRTLCAGEIRDFNPESPNLFERLGLDPTDPDFEDPTMAEALLKAAYKLAQKKYHPDSNLPGAEPDADKFVKVVEAYEKLTENHAWQFYRLRSEKRKLPKETQVKTTWKWLADRLRDHRRKLEVAYHFRGEDPSEMRVFREGFLALLKEINTNYGSRGGKVFGHTVGKSFEGVKLDDVTSDSQREALDQFLDRHLQLFVATSPSPEDLRVAQKELYETSSGFSGGQFRAIAVKHVERMWSQALNLAIEPAQKRAVAESYFQNLLHQRMAAAGIKDVEKKRAVAKKMRRVLRFYDREVTPYVAEAGSSLDFLERIYLESLESEVKQRPEGFQKPLQNRLKQSLFLIYKQDPDRALVLLHRMFERLDAIAPEPKADELHGYKAKRGPEFDRLDLMSRVDDLRREVRGALIHFMNRQKGDEILARAVEIPRLRDIFYRYFVGDDYGTDRNRCSRLFRRLRKVLRPKKNLPPPPVDDEE